MSRSAAGRGPPAGAGCTRGSLGCLVDAALGGDQERVKRLLKAGVGASTLCSCQGSPNCGCSPLLAACAGGHGEVVRLLVEAGADMVAPRRALNLAAYIGNEGVVEQLLRARAQVDAANKNGDTALMAASQEGHQGVVEQLLRAGAQVEAADKEGFTALMLASQQGHQGVVEALLRAGAQTEAATKYGVTSLMEASKEGHIEVVRSLLACGADVNAAGPLGTALHASASCGHEGVMRLLLAAGAQTEVVDKTGLSFSPP